MVEQQQQAFAKRRGRSKSVLWVGRASIVIVAVLLWSKSQQSLLEEIYHLEVEDAVRRDTSVPAKPIIEVSTASERLPHKVEAIQVPQDEELADKVDKEYVAKWSHPDVVTKPYAVQPLWNCSRHANENHDKKLIFVHVAKTAGSSFRQLFLRLYGPKCHKSIGILIRCSQLEAKSMLMGDHGAWTNSKDVKCVFKDHHAVLPADTPVPTDMTNSILQDTDILIGHLPIGVHTSVVPGDVRYITFFREPVAKLISGLLYSNRNGSKEGRWVTFEAAIESMRNLLKGAVARKQKFESYSRYLLTPQERLLNLTKVQKVTAVKNNLQGFQVVVGVVERMSESLHVLQHVIDGTGHATAHFDVMNSSKEGKTLVANKSNIISTNGIIAELEKDPVFFAQIKECLSLEFELYEYAVTINKKQYASTL